MALQTCDESLQDALQDAFITERDVEIHEIKKEMVQVNLLFKEMATLINSQGEVVDSIANNISYASQNVNDAKNSLIEAEKTESNKSLCWVAGLVSGGVGIATAIVTSFILL